jgi:hypothetical protein
VTVAVRMYETHRSDPHRVTRRPPAPEETREDQKGAGDG